MLKEPIAFIFDMDGTMIDNMRFHTQAWLRFLDNSGISMTAEEMEHQNHGKIEEIIRRIFGNHLSDTEVKELGERKESLYRQMYHPHLHPIAGLETFLKNARTLNIPMAIATSAGQANLDFTINGLGFASYFDAFVGGDDVKQGKPHPETFLLAAQHLNVEPKQCIVFEDTIAGIKAAENAGMKAIAITTIPSQAFASPVVLQVIPNYTSIEPASLISHLQELSDV